MTTKITFTYNPYATKNKTQFLLDGKEWKPESLKELRDLTLQSWIDSLFDELHNSLNEKCFSFEFVGTEVDCEDMRNAVTVARENGFKIEYTENCIKTSATDRLKALEKLIKEMEQNPLYKEKISNHRDLCNTRDGYLDILVVAPMSSGKSTFINALLGCDILAAKEEATTAAVAEITHNPDMPQGIFKAYRVNNENSEILGNEVTFDLTQPEHAKEAQKIFAEWNSDIDKEKPDSEKTGKIKLEGKFIGINLGEQLIKFRLHDTPGPNNSLTENHRAEMMNAIKYKGNTSLILYILNGRQLRVDSENDLLSKIAEEIKNQGCLAKERFVFVANQMDAFFKDTESISDTLIRTKEYLFKQHNILNPKIYPVSAYLAKLFRMSKLNKDLLSEDSQDDLNNLTSRINRNENRDLTSHMELNSRVRQKVDVMPDSALKRSGIPALEAVINDYIEKYYEPQLVVKITQALDQILEGVKPELEKITELKNKSESELKELSENLEKTRKKLENSDKFPNFIQGLKDKEIGLSDKTAKLFEQRQKSIEEVFIKEEREKFIKVNSESEANRIVNELKSKLENLLDELAANVMQVNDDEQKIVLDDLKISYENFVKEEFGEIFEGIGNVKMVENFTKQSVDIQNYLSLDISSVKKTETYKVTVKRDGILGAIYDLFSPKTEIRNRTFFDLSSIEKTIFSQITEEILAISREYSEQVKANSKALTETFCLQLNDVFKQKTDDFIRDIQEKSQNKDQLNEVIKDYEGKLINNNRIIEQIKQYATL